MSRTGRPERTITPPQVRSAHPDRVYGRLYEVPRQRARNDTES